MAKDGHRIGIRLSDIDKGVLARLHLHQIELGLMIAHAGPRFALGTALP